MPVKSLWLHPHCLPALLSWGLYLILGLGSGMLLAQLADSSDSSESSNLQVQSDTQSTDITTQSFNLSGEPSGLLQQDFFQSLAADSQLDGYVIEVILFQRKQVDLKGEQLPTGPLPNWFAPVVSIQDPTLESIDLTLPEVSIDRQQQQEIPDFWGTIQELMANLNSKQDIIKTSDKLHPAGDKVTQPWLLSTSSASQYSSEPSILLSGHQANLGDQLADGVDREKANNFWQRLKKRLRSKLPSLSTKPGRQLHYTFVSNPVWSGVAHPEIWQSTPVNSTELSNEYVENDFFNQANFSGILTGNFTGEQAFQLVQANKTNALLDNNASSSQVVLQEQTFTQSLSQDALTLTELYFANSTNAEVKTENQTIIKRQNFVYLELSEDFEGMRSRLDNSLEYQVLFQGSWVQPAFSFPHRLGVYIDKLQSQPLEGLFYLWKNRFLHFASHMVAYKMYDITAASTQSQTLPIADNQVRLIDGSRKTTDWDTLTYWGERFSRLENHAALQEIEPSNQTQSNLAQSTSSALTIPTANSLTGIANQSLDHSLASLRDLMTGQNASLLGPILGTGSSMSPKEVTTLETSQLADANQVLSVPELFARLQPKINQLRFSKSKVVQELLQWRSELPGQQVQATLLEPSFVYSASRKIGLDEIHYFDHPSLGMIVRVRPESSLDIQPEN